MMAQWLAASLLLLVAVPLGAQTGISGRWQATGVPNGPWIMEFQISGNKVTGNVRQGGPSGEPQPIYFGSIEGNAVTFKVNSPDGDRIITFNGKITRNEIGFSRLVELRPGGLRGDTGILGGNAILNFSARRMN
jgi:hypothetical protein